MPNPTRQEIINANNALAALICFAHSHTTEPDEMDWIMTKGRAITAVIPPKPQPTMADVEWDDDKHYLAGAITPVGREAVMLWHDDVDTGNIVTTTGEWRRDQLTPTGKRYTLTEVQDD